MLIFHTGADHLVETQARILCDQHSQRIVYHAGICHAHGYAVELKIELQDIPDILCDRSALLRRIFTEIFHITVGDKGLHGHIQTNQRHTEACSHDNIRCFGISVDICLRVVVDIARNINTASHGHNLFQFFRQGLILQISFSQVGHTAGRDHNELSIQFVSFPDDEIFRRLRDRLLAALRQDHIADAVVTVDISRSRFKYAL